MSDLIFRPYFEEQQQKVARFFATEHKEDFLEDLIFNDYNLINEAFDDLNVLMSYKASLSAFGTLSNEQFGFIANHVNSLERKYKGLITVETLVSESHNSAKKATIVSEAISTRTALLLGGLIAAVVGLIAWFLGKGKEETTKANNKATATIAETKEILKKATKESPEDAEAKKQMEERNAARKKAADEEIARMTEKAISDLNEALKKNEDNRKEKERLEKLKAIEQEKEDAAKKRLEALEAKKKKEDELGATAPSFSSFETSSIFLHQFCFAKDPTAVSFKDLEYCIKQFYKYSCELSDLIDFIVTATKRYSEDLQKVLKDANRDWIHLNGEFDRIFVGVDQGLDDDKLHWRNKALEQEVKQFKSIHDTLWEFITDDYGSVMGQEIVTKNSVFNGCPHSIQFSMSGKSAKTDKKKKFTLFKGITPYECYELNNQCEDFTNDSAIVINTTKSAFNKLQQEMRAIKANMDLVKKEIDLYTKTGILGKLDSNQSHYAMGFVSGLTKDIRSNMSLVGKLEKISNKNLQECCEMVKAIAKTAVKK